MKKIYAQCLATLLLILLSAAYGYSQVNLTATGGTLSGSYSTLKGAFDAINAGTHQGTITISLTGNTTEPLSAILNASGSGSASYTSVTISPSGGAARSITGAITGHLVELNGADNVTINGLNTGGNTLTISNTAIGGCSTIHFIGDASNNSVTNCTLSGSGTSLGVVFFDTGTTTGNDNNTISNNNIGAAGVNNPLNGIYSLGSSAVIDNSGNTVTGNKIFDYYNATLSTSGMNINSFSSAWTITNNRLYQTANRLYTTANTHYGIFITSGSGYTITGNIIGYANSTGTGTTNMIGNSVDLTGFPASYTWSGTSNATLYVAINCAFTAAGTVSSIQNNTIAGFALFTSSGTSTTKGIFCGIAVTSGPVNIGTVTGNTIGSSTGTGSIYTCTTTTAGIIAGIYVTSTDAVSIQNNIIGALDAMGSSSTICGGINGVNTAGPSISYNVSGNTIGNSTNPNLRMGNLTTGANLSNVGTTFGTATGAAQFNGILSTQTGAGTIGTLSLPNTITNAYLNSSAATTATSIRGITASGIPTIGYNQINNLTAQSANVAVSSTLLAGMGIFMNSISTIGAVVTGNNIHTLILANTTASGTNLAGIALYCSTIDLYNNKIYDLQNASTSVTTTTPGTASGIFLRQPAGTQRIYNNFISLGNGQTTNTAFNGIWMQNSAVAYTMNCYFNSINIEGTAAAGAQPSFCFNRGSYSATQVLTPVNILNNIFSNTRSGGTGKHYAIGNEYGGAAIATGWGANASNYNVLNAAAANVGYWGADMTFAGWQAASLSDANSFSGITVNYINTATGDLHLNMGVTPTFLESNGVVIAGIAFDYDNQVRPGPAGSVNGGAAAPDLGADEFDGKPLDLAPPAMTYVPLLNTSSTTARILTTTITDVTGVPTLGVGLPRCYWRINSGSWNNVPGVFVSGNTYTFTFGAGVVLGDVVSYYLVAQDICAPPNVGSSPSAGASGFSINPPACSTPPTPPNSYTIVGTICGVKTVGTGGDYLTLTAAAADLNNKEMTCAVTWSILATYSSAGETFPVVINKNPGSSVVNTLTIKPAAGVTASVSGANASGPLMTVLNGNTIIDGSNVVNGTTRNLTFNNTGATTPQVIFVGSGGALAPLTNFTLKNCILINGVNSSSALVLTKSDATAGYFNNITIQNNSIQLAYIGIYYWTDAVAGNGSNTLITQNDLSTSGANSIRLCAIYVQGADGATVSNNTIGNMNNTVDAANFTGIWFATGTINSTISGNTVTQMTSTTGAPRGIAVSSGVSNANVTIIGNDVNNITTSSSTAPYGITLFSTTTGVVIRNNKVWTMLNSNTGGYGCRGLYVNTGLPASNVSVINNLVYDIKATSDASLAYFLIGMGTEAATGGVNFYHNSVYLSGTYAGYTSGTISTCLYIGASATTIDMRNNIFENTYDNTASTTDKSYAIYCATGNTAFTNINYNNYFVTTSGTPWVLGYLGADQATLAAWKIATAQDVNSISVDPVFVSTTDLHPTAAAVQRACAYLAAANADFIGTLRTNPTDMGAYQVSTGSQTVTTNAATAILTTTATLNGSINANNLTVASGFEYGLTTAYGTVVAGVPATVTGAVGTPINAAIAGLTSCTLYHFRAKGTSGAVIVNGADLTFTTAGVTPTSTTTAATAVTSTTATLNGTVNPNGVSTSITFDYGLTTTYGTNVPGVPSPITGSSPLTVSAAITGLLPGNTYHYRVNGVNSCASASGTDMTFTTPAILPAVVTTAATAVTSTTATLNGTVDAGGASTAVWFDYGLTTTYGTTVAGTPTPVTGNTVTPVSANIIGLVTNTTYHFRVRGVNSVGTTNGNDMSFQTNCPVAGPAGPITGPTQVCQGQCGYVYSVTIPNATGYVWTLPVGGTITAGANTNTITVCYAANAAPGYVFVYGTASCGNGAPSQLGVAMNPPATPTITGPASVCVNSAGNVYTTQAGMSNYTWTVSAGGAITGGGSTNAITVTWSTTGAKTVTVNYQTAAGCWAIAPTSYAVTVNPLPTPTISGPSPACSNYPGLVYSTQAGMTGYNWSISAGGLITGGTGTNSITVTWNTTGAQSVSVNYTNGNGCSAAAPVTYPVTVNSGAAPTITGPNNLCVNSGYNNYTTEPGMSGYAWTISAGGVINYGSGTNVVTVSWAGSGSQWVAVNYTNPGGCSAAAPVQFNVTVNPLPGPAGSITGTAVVCGGANGVAYSTPVISGVVTYVWTLPVGATIASGAGTNAITVNFAGNASSGNITVVGNNMCGNGAASPPFAVTVNALPANAGTITGPANVCQGDAGKIYNVPAILGATGYVWSLPAGVAIVAGNNTNAITVDFDATAVSGVITVAGTNSCGSGTVSPNFNLTVNPIPAAAVASNTGYTANSSAATGNQWYYSVTATGTGASISGATGQNYDATLTGTGYYWVIVTVNGCPSAESNRVLIITTGVENHAGAGISLYPVPNDGKFTVTFSSNDTYTINVFNNIGVKIYEEKNVEVNSSTNKVIDLRPVPNGVYTVIFENSLNQVVKKIVVNK